MSADSPEEIGEAFIRRIAREVVLRMFDSAVFRGSVISVVIGLVIDWVLNAGRATAGVIALIGDQFRLALGDAGYALVHPFQFLGGDLLDWLAVTSVNATGWMSSFGPFAPIVAVLAVGIGVWVMIVLLSYLLEAVKWVT